MFLRKDLLDNCSVTLDNGNGRYGNIIEKIGNIIEKSNLNFRHYDCMTEW